MVPLNIGRASQNRLSGAAAISRFHFLGNATGRMPNPQSTNHQSRDGSGSGDRGRTFRPIEVSGRCPCFGCTRLAGRRRGPANRRHQHSIFSIRRTITEGSCCDWFAGKDARADGGGRMAIIVRFGCIRMEWRRFGMPFVRRLEPGTAGTEAAQRQHSIQKNDTIIQMMGPREEPFLAASSTPTTHPDPRSIDSHTNRMDCKRGRCLV